MTAGYDALAARWDAALMGNYGTPALALARGDGARVWDVDGREYLDLLAGIAVSSLGHAHPAIRAAVDDAMATLGHTSNLAMHESVVALAERLLTHLGAVGPGRVLFANSGTEANEAALKIARRHARDVTPDGSRTRLVAAEGAFHGRTLGALSITGQPAKREPFEPLPGPVDFVPYGDADALRATVTTRTAAVFLEPAMGEAGVVVPPLGYLAAARAVCDATGALLVLDEVQGGIGRTGHWFAHQHPALGAGVRPDVVTLAKGLGGGLPIGAVLGVGAAAHALRAGDHGSTFAGGPVVTAAALAVLDELARPGALDRVTEVGALLAAGLARPAAVERVEGAGLWLGVVLADPLASALEGVARAAGFLVGACGPRRLRLAPPLVLTAEQAECFLAAWPGLLADAQSVAMVGA